MAKLKFTIHPLFFLFGLYFAIKGKLLIFIIYTTVAVMHELGHSIVAARLGYKLNRIVLMPYGAVITGDIQGLKFRDEIEVALAGPFVNLACAILFIAMWWIFPETYAYTDTAVTACLSIALVNLIPCRPLDGGRVLRAFLSLYAKQKFVDVSLKISGVLFSCVLGVFFIFSCFHSVNFSLFFFSLFVFFGTVFTGKENIYVKIYENSYKKNLERGAEIKTIGVSKNTTVKKLISLLDSRSLTVVQIYNDDTELVKILSPKQTCELVSGDTLYMKVGEVAEKITSRIT